MGAQAAPISAQGPTFPTPFGPGTTTFSGPLDDMGKTGGLTLHMDTWDFGVGRAFWWGPTDDVYFTGPGVGAALDGAIDSAGEFLTYTGGGVWTGTSEIILDDGGSGTPTAVDIRYTVTTVTGATGPIDPSLLSIDTADTPAVWQVTGDPFEVNQLMEARFSSGGSFTPLVEFFESQVNCPTCGGNALMSIQGALFYTPEPSTTLMLGLGLAGLAGFGSRRRS